MPPQSLQSEGGEPGAKAAYRQGGRNGLIVSFIAGFGRRLTVKSTNLLTERVLSRPLRNERLDWKDLSTYSTPSDH